MYSVGPILLAFVVSASVSELPNLSIEEAVVPDVESQKIEIAGWVSVQPEDNSLCAKQHQPKKPCLWLEINVGPDFPEERFVENCRKTLRWHKLYNGRKVLLRGLLVPGPAGHLGVSSGAIQEPEVLEILQEPEEKDDYLGICEDVISQYGKVTSNKPFKYVPPASWLHRTWLRQAA